jgi:hypothetical protein
VVVGGTRGGLGIILSLAPQGARLRSSRQMRFVSQKTSPPIVQLRPYRQDRNWSRGACVPVLTRPVPSAASRSYATTAARTSARRGPPKWSPRGERGVGDIRCDIGYLFRARQECLCRKLVQCLEGSPLADAFEHLAIPGQPVLRITVTQAKDNQFIFLNRL